MMKGVNIFFNSDTILLCSYILVLDIHQMNFFLSHHLFLEIDITFSPLHLLTSYMLHVVCVCSCVCVLMYYLLSSLSKLSHENHLTGQI